MSDFEYTLDSAVHKVVTAGTRATVCARGSGFDESRQDGLSEDAGGIQSLFPEIIRLASRLPLEYVGFV